MVVVPALLQRIAGGHHLILLHVDHGIHLHQTGAVLQGHEIGGLVGNVQQQGEGGLIAVLLHSALGRRHGGILLRTGAGIVPGLLGPLIHQNEADVAPVTGNGGDTGIHPDVIILGNEVIALGGGGTAGLAEPGVPVTVVVLAVVVILGYQQVGGIDTVNPGGDIGHVVIGGLAGYSVHKNRADHIRTVEQADGFIDHRGHPIGGAGLIDLKVHIMEQAGGVGKAQVPAQIPPKVFGRGVLDALFQTDHTDLLGAHIDGHIGGDAVAVVVPPFEEAAVVQIIDTHRAALIVDLGGGGADGKLADKIAQLAQLTVGQVV